MTIHRDPLTLNAAIKAATALLKEVSNLPLDEGDAKLTDIYHTLSDVTILSGNTTLEALLSEALDICHQINAILHNLMGEDIPDTAETLSQEAWLLDGYRVIFTDTNLEFDIYPTISEAAEICNLLQEPGNCTPTTRVEAWYHDQARNFDFRKIVYIPECRPAPSFKALHGRAPEPGVDFDEGATLCQDDYQHLTGTGNYSDNAKAPARLPAFDYLPKATLEDSITSIQYMLPRLQLTASLMVNEAKANGICPQATDWSEGYLAGVEAAITYLRAAGIKIPTL